ncbi:MAG: Gfo/Idh/MocA family oxidoreductase [Verrucomicrobiales bacterium]
MNPSPPLRWGILGTGMIARKFAPQLGETPLAELAFAASRDRAKAKAFAAEVGAARFGDYDEMLADPEVDAIYVSLPNEFHKPWAIRALEAGKHVLCEKPLAGNAADAGEMFAAAERCGRVLVEAFMYRLLPVVRKAVELARGGAIGEIRAVQSAFTFRREADRADGRYWSGPGQGGGALMDVGCYPLHFARAIIGEEPSECRCVARLHEFGVDEYAAAALKFPGGAVADFVCGMTVDGHRATHVLGTEGSLYLPDPWLGEPTLVLRRDLEASEEFHLPKPMGSYALEAEAFHAAAAGGAEPWITKADTLGNLRALDALRREIGVAV